MEKVYVIISDNIDEVHVTHELEKAEEIKKKMKNSIANMGYMIPSVRIREIVIE